MKSVICAVCVAAVTTCAWAEAPYQVAWISQIGTSLDDFGVSVAVDTSGNAYLSGHTYGDFGGPSTGDDDAFLSKFDSGGNEVWTIEIGTSAVDRSESVAVDASGDIYISGVTYGMLGGPSPGYGDAFVSKFDSGGNEIWTTQIGSSRVDWSRSVAVDASGNAYISGYTRNDSGDVFLSKLDADGNAVWWTEIGTSVTDQSQSVAVDASGNAYVSGYTGGNLGGSFAGSDDAFLSKFDSDGNEIWTTQIGSSRGDWSHSVAVDASGDIYISGHTEGDLGGPNAGEYDAFLRKFDSEGNEVWTSQIGTSAADSSQSVAVDTVGNVYISGTTEGDLGGPNAGYYDAFLVKYEVPEPATLGMLALGGLAVLRRRKRGMCK